MEENESAGLSALGMYQQCAEALGTELNRGFLEFVWNAAHDKRERNQELAKRYQIIQEWKRMDMKLETHIETCIHRLIQPYKDGMRLDFTASMLPPISYNQSSSISTQAPAQDPKSSSPGSQDKQEELAVALTFDADQSSASSVPANLMRIVTDNQHGAPPQAALNTTVQRGSGRQESLVLPDTANNADTMPQRNVIDRAPALEVHDHRISGGPELGLRGEQDALSSSIADTTDSNNNIPHLGMREAPSEDDTANAGSSSGKRQICTLKLRVPARPSAKEAENAPKNSRDTLGEQGDVGPNKRRCLSSNQSPKEPREGTYQCTRVDVWNRGIWIHPVTGQEHFLKCPDCPKMDFQSLKGYKSHYSKEHKKQGIRVTDLAEALTKYGKSVKEHLEAVQPSLQRSIAAHEAVTRRPCGSVEGPLYSDSDSDEPTAGGDDYEEDEDYEDSEEEEQEEEGNTDVVPKSSQNARESCRGVNKQRSTGIAPGSGSSMEHDSNRRSVASSSATNASAVNRTRMPKERNNGVQARHQRGLWSPSPSPPPRNGQLRSKTSSQSNQLSTPVKPRDIPQHEGLATAGSGSPSFAGHGSSIADDANNGRALAQTELQGLSAGGLGQGDR